MSTLELLQLQNEHNDNFFGKGEDATEEQECGCATIKNDKSDIYIIDKIK